MSEENHQHKEAFRLMTYTCKECKHNEIIWNARDGVTPFGTSCPRCGRPNFIHTGPDQYAPNHVPWPGQYIWITWPQELRAPFGRARVEAAKGTRFEIEDPTQREETARSITEGLQPGEPFKIRWFPTPEQEGQSSNLPQEELPDAAQITTDVVNGWLTKYATWPLTMSITKLSLAIVEALRDAIELAYNKGKQDGGKQE